ncbi:DedA family protein [Pseudactinotalea sp. HY158]|uniref:DedA family protein n=1 Tax=unclassified Pseudactinotalea TaxID=2649176 RepID=UPI00129C45F7|nr:DedA family protein [Pseudactinotalea sp. HY158]MPV51249.1 DedA family protein [Pseudactinotalea sp. HY160]QGH69667.1 DedA family protein [Pseudactinotalea sp. HY158]
MSESILSLVHEVVSSPWVYAALFALAALDGFLPIIPGETALVVVAVYASSGDGQLALVILAGAVGAFAGDHVAYLIGRRSIGRLRTGLRSGGRGRAAYDWVHRTLARRGGQVLLASRYVPGVRTATTLTMGAVGYPLRRFSAVDAAAAVFWAGGWSLLGYLAGATVGDDPIRGLLLGLGLMLAVTALGEAGRRIWRARRPHTQAIEATEAVGPTGGTGGTEEPRLLVHHSCGPTGGR